MKSWGLPEKTDDISELSTEAMFIILDNTDDATKRACFCVNSLAIWNTESEISK